jgi:hypothetical protein
VQAHLIDLERRGRVARKEQAAEEIWRIAA